MSGSGLKKKEQTAGLLTLLCVCVCGHVCLDSETMSH